MNSINYISTIPFEYTSKIITMNVLNKAIKHLKSYVFEEHREIKWKKEYLEQETFVNGISTKTGKLHLILPKYSYTINLKKQYKKSIVKRIGCNAIILAKINDAYNAICFSQKAYVEYFICLIVRRYAYQSFKNHISSDMTLNEVLSETWKYLCNMTSNEDVIEQVKKNSNKTTTEGEQLTRNEKIGISVRESKKRNQEEIDYIIDLHKQKQASRVIAARYQEKFMKRISHMTITRIIKENYKEEVKPEVYIKW